MSYQSDRSLPTYQPTLFISSRAGETLFKVKRSNSFYKLENRRCKSIQIDRGVPNQQQALSSVLGEGSAGESPIDPIFLIAPHSSRPGTKKSLRWADANLDLSTEQFHSSRSLNPIFNVPSPPCLTPSIFLSGVSQAAKPFILIKERVFPPSINGIGLSELLTAVKANRESQVKRESLSDQCISHFQFIPSQKK